MDHVYLLHHIRKDDTYMDDAKLIGVYSSQTTADEAVNRLRYQPGFVDYPEGFHIEKYELNKDHWVEGFISSDEAMDSFDEAAEK
jgi:hypothetical protein